MANFDIVDVDWEDTTTPTVDRGMMGLERQSAPGWGLGYAPGWGFGDAAATPVLVTPTVPVAKPSFMDDVQNQAKAVWAMPVGKVAMIGAGALVAKMLYDKYGKKGRFAF